MVDNPIRLEDIVTGWDEIAEAHRNSQPGRWEVCREFCWLHADAAELVATGAGRFPSAIDRTMMLLAIHAWNLYTVLVGLIARGQFDVAPLLFRALFDVGPLFYSSATDSDFGEGATGKLLKASVARIRLIDDLRADGKEDEASRLEKLLRDVEYPLMQKLAHVNPTHLAQLIRPATNARELALGGHRDDEQYAVMLETVLQFEFRNLAFIHHTCHHWLGKEWSVRFQAAMLRYAVARYDVREQAHS